jgi:hypothetical protein
MNEDLYKGQCLYKGRPLESYSKEELIEIAREGWAAYHRQLEASARDLRFLSDLRSAR